MSEYVHESTLEDIFSKNFDDVLTLSKVHSEYNGIISSLKLNRWVVNPEPDIYQITRIGLEKAQTLGIHRNRFHPCFQPLLDLEEIQPTPISIEIKPTESDTFQVLLYDIRLSLEEEVLVTTLHCYGYLDMKNEICNTCEVRGACYQKTFSLILSKRQDQL
jgi:hypothetical protein